MFTFFGIGAIDFIVSFLILEDFTGYAVAGLSSQPGVVMANFMQDIAQAAVLQHVQSNGPEKGLYHAVTFDLKNTGLTSAANAAISIAERGDAREEAIHLSTRADKAEKLKLASDLNVAISKAFINHLNNVDKIH